MRTITASTGILMLLCLILPSHAFPQPWQFVKERDGIKLFVRQEANTPFKTFHGETTFRGNYSLVCSLIGDPARLDWWDDDIRDIRVLAYEKDKLIRYYFVYDVPWPFTDRDLVAEVKLSGDPLTGPRTVFSKPLLNLVPRYPEMVRVTDFWQKWTIRPLKDGKVQVTLEGYINPAGDVPAWLYNMVIVDIPLRLLKEIRNRAGDGG
ncbi:MAG: lipid-binding START domain-containing protein [Bacteroidetes bacterium]|jgi:hypothetical protein|nr:MAG: lipid-binding START domain-containing protein [Bacteroidota bacterium]